ncbi:hypothetical protein [Rhodococcus koreensis]
MAHTIVAQGLDYLCRRGHIEVALVVDGRKPPTLTVVSSAPVDAGWARERVLAALGHDCRSGMGMMRQRAG